MTSWGSWRPWTRTPPSCCGCSRWTSCCSSPRVTGTGLPAAGRKAGLPKSPWPGGSSFTNCTKQILFSSATPSPKIYLETEGAGGNPEHQKNKCFCRSFQPEGRACGAATVLQSTERWPATYIFLRLRFSPGVMHRRIPQCSVDEPAGNSWNVSHPHSSL